MNLPERIYVDTKMNGIAFQVPTKSLLEKDVEYIRKDLVIEFATSYMLKSVLKPINEMLDEFLNSRSK